MDRFGQPEEYAPGQQYAGLSESPSLVVDEQTHEVFAINRATHSIDVFTRGLPKTAADATIKDPTTTLTEAVLHGIVNPDGVATTECYFEWGKTTAYGQKSDCTEGGVFNGSADHSVSAEIPLTVGSTYHVQLVVRNEEGLLSKSPDLSFVPQKTPVVERLFVDNLNTDSARLNAIVDLGRGDTTYRFEYGPDTSFGSSIPVPDEVLPGQFLPKAISQTLQNLDPGTLYHYRIVATNLGGTGERSGTFSTFPRVPVLEDKCSNALSRQQTGAALLPDCRAYELASASDTGGYNVESDLVPGQTPFNGYPVVDGELLYGTHNGGIPGTGNPTNLGIDPYVAVRGNEGWTTKYVGIPANATPSASPFASTLLAADQNLDTFAFGDADICAPCFSDGTSGIPVRRQGGELAQGMTGPENPGAAAKPDGLIAKSLSADGGHLIFGSVLAFHEDGNDNTGDISIYDRDLDTGTTQVISTSPSGGPLTCLQGAGTCHSPGGTNGIAELDVSSDGSRVVVAQKVATDSDGNVYWHPYMHIGSDPHTVDLAPGATHGVLFDGMTSDGSKFFFTTQDKLAAGDTDSNADIYVDEIAAGGGPVVPQLVSVKSNGEPSNASSCAPVTEWNTVEPGSNCNAVALGGGGGVASGTGTFYFLSPEVLDGSSGEENQANLYVVKPGGDPHFVTTMDSSARKPNPAAPTREVLKNPAITGIIKPRALAVDDATGDIYVEDVYKEEIERFTSSGVPDPFTQGAGTGTNELLKTNGESPLANVGERNEPAYEAIAVDNHPGSPIKGAVYVANKSTPGLAVFSAGGAQIGDIKGLSEDESLVSPCGVSVSESTGDVYVGSGPGGYSPGGYSQEGVIWRLHLISATLPLGLSNYEVTELHSNGDKLIGPCRVAVDTLGHVYAINCGGCNPQANPANRRYMGVFDESSFAPLPGGEAPGEFMTSDAQDIAVDQSTNELLMDMGPRIDVRGPLGELRETLGQGDIQSSEGLAVNGATHYIYVSTRKEVVEIGYQPDPSKPIDNPAVLDAVRQAEVRHPEDFQVTPDGRFAAFPTAARITEYDPYGRLQIYRYDANADSTICVSCPPSNTEVFHNASLARHGNSVTSDGRVFFNTADAIVLRDTNGNLDAYEWSKGDVQLISAGTGPFDSGLLSVSEDGKDAFFFTRDNLAPGDRNGTLMRIYDAREDGGFFHVPPPPPCAASDECHGPGSQAAPPAEIGSLGGTRGNLRNEKPKCRPGFVKKHGKCVRKRHRRHDHRGRKRQADR
jgi:hypothetical protein